MGFEPTTHSLEGCCSIQLSYGHTTYIKCFLVQVKSSTSCEYDVYLATPCHCSCVSRAAKIGCEKSIYFRKYYIETYLTPFASALIMIVKLLYLLLLLLLLLSLVTCRLGMGLSFRPSVEMPLMSCCCCCCCCGRVSAMGLSGFPRSMPAPRRRSSNI